MTRGANCDRLQGGSCSPWARATSGPFIYLWSKAASSLRGPTRVRVDHVPTESQPSVWRFTEIVRNTLSVRSPSSDFHASRVHTPLKLAQPGATWVSGSWTACVFWPPPSLSGRHVTCRRAENETGVQLSCRLAGRTCLLAVFYGCLLGECHSSFYQDLNAFPKNQDQNFQYVLFLLKLSLPSPSTCICNVKRL